MYSQAVVVPGCRMWMHDDQRLWELSIEVAVEASGTEECRASCVYGHM